MTISLLIVTTTNEQEAEMAKAHYGQVALQMPIQLIDLGRQVIGHIAIDS